nr:DUF2079 domain-containing protein [Candidatus Omnitrophota bacterium]
MTAQPVPTETHQSRLFLFLNWASAAALGVGLFWILTGGIPLIDAGFLPEPPAGKKYFVKTTQYILLLPILVFIAIWFFRREDFSKLWAVRLTERLCRHDHGVIAGLFVYQAVALSAVGWARHLALETRAFDMGIFAQAIWNTLQGHFLESSLKGGICLLGDHFSPLLAALAPVYGIWPDPRNLLLLQAVASAACIFPIAAIARRELGGNRWAILFALMYVLYMPSRAAAHEDFHPELLVEPFLLWGWLAFERGKKFLFLICLLIVLSAKENMAGLTAAFGLYAVWTGRRKGLGVGLIAFSLLYLILCVKWAIPQLSGAPYLYRGFYKQLLSLGGLVNVLADSERWEYLLKIYGSFLFLPFFNPVGFLTAPIFLQNWLSENGVTRSMNYHYTTGLAPFLFVSTMVSLKKFRQSQKLR